MKLALGTKKDDGSIFSVIEFAIGEVFDIDRIIPFEDVETADAYIKTQRGYNLVYLDDNFAPIRVSIEQDRIYALASTKRGYWTLRTHGKEGTLREMVGLTEIGKRFAATFNQIASKAPGINLKREEHPDLELLGWPLKSTS